MGKDTSNDGDDNLNPLRVLARALVPHLRDELGLDAGPRMATMMTADETPSPRATKEACSTRARTWGAEASPSLDLRGLRVA